LRRLRWQQCSEMKVWEIVKEREKEEMKEQF
jgi:hypothetical protein